jgi:hypothetical protein
VSSKLTPKGQALLEAMRVTFAQLGELERSAPGDANAITSAIVAHIRSWKPMALLATPLEDK